MKLVFGIALKMVNLPFIDSAQYVLPPTVLIIPTHFSPFLEAWRTQ
jgi:hypothetical protein